MKPSMHLPGRPKDDCNRRWVLIEADFTRRHVSDMKSANDKVTRWLQGLLWYIRVSHSIVGSEAELTKHH